MKFIEIFIFYFDFINQSNIFLKTVNDYYVIDVLKFVSSFQYDSLYLPLFKKGRDGELDFSNLMNYDFAFSRFKNYLLEQDEISKIVEGEM